MDTTTARARRGVCAGLTTALACAAFLAPAAPASATTVCVPATQVCVDDGGASDALIGEVGDQVAGAVATVNAEAANAVAAANAQVAGAVAQANATVGVALGVPPTAVNAARGISDVCVTTLCVRGVGGTVAYYDDELCAIHPAHVSKGPWDRVRDCDQR